jgi:hypothetical protein
MGCPRASSALVLAIEALSFSLNQLFPVPLRFATSSGTRSHDNFFMNGFRKLGLMSYKGRIQLHMPRLNDGS